MAAFCYLSPMSESDLDWVSATEQRAYPFPWSKNGFVKALDGGLCYVFYDCDDQPLGYACFLTVLDELHLLNFCISPDFQAKGVGFRAFQGLLQHFENTCYELVLLEVRQSNRAAIRLYQKIGFQVDGKRPNYYPTTEGREDAVLMSLHLKEVD